MKIFNFQLTSWFLDIFNLIKIVILEFETFIIHLLNEN